MGVFMGVGYGQANLVVKANALSWNFIITMGFKDNGGGGNAANAASVWTTAWTGGAKPFAPANYSNEYTVVRCDATIMTATGPQIGTQNIGAVGTAVMNSTPPNSAILVNKGTARGGRRGRGRIFLPPCFVDEANISPGGVIAGTQLTALQTLVTAVLTAASATAYPPYLLHDVSEVAPDAITGLSVQNRLATQRTRLRK